MLNLGTRRIIVPISGELSADQRMQLIRSLAPEVWGFKLFPSTIIRCLRESRVDLIEEAQKAGARVFIDFKGYDIPSEIAGMVSDYEAGGVDILTVHISGGRPMLEEVVQKRRSAIILGVTILTSMKDEDVRVVYGTRHQRAVRERKIVEFARLAQEMELDGTVSSPTDLDLIRDDPKVGNGTMIRCTPGIRPAGSVVAGDDQSRSSTPKAAIRSGSHLFVIGRPITRAADPVAAAIAINKEIEDAL